MFALMGWVAGLLVAGWEDKRGEGRDEAKEGAARGGPGRASLLLLVLFRHTGAGRGSSRSLGDESRDFISPHPASAHPGTSRCAGNGHLLVCAQPRFPA